MVDMKRMIVRLSPAAVFVMSLVASASATQPVFYGVTELGKTVGTVKIAGTLGASLLEGKESKSQITCVGATATGEVTGPTKTTNNIITFVGCETSGIPCKSSGGGAGEITTTKLDGVLGNVTATTPGIRLFKEGEGGETEKPGRLAEIECGGIVKVEVFGSVIGSLSGAQGKTPEEGKFAASNKLTFAQTAGKQKYRSFLAGECGGEPGDCGPEQLVNLNTPPGSGEEAGESVIVTLKTTPFPSKLGFTK
jgi:hypothetical protein